MKNKLTYLGFLGLLGFAGLFGTPLLFAFFGFLVFFRHIKTVPDELFWDNVRVSATRGYFTFLVPLSVIVVSAHLLFESENLYSYAPALLIGGFSLAMGVSIIVFAGNLGILEAEESRSKDDEEDS